jgi:hypothetical protein
MNFRKFLPARRLSRTLLTALALLANVLVVVGLSAPAHATDCSRQWGGTYRDTLTCVNFDMYFSGARFTSPISVAAMFPNRSVTFSGQMTDTRQDGRCAWLEASHTHGGRFTVPDSKVCDGQSKAVGVKFEGPATTSDGVLRVYFVSGNEDWNFWSHRVGESAGNHWVNIANAN